MERNYVTVILCIDNLVKNDAGLLAGLERPPERDGCYVYTRLHFCAAYRSPSFMRTGLRCPIAA